VAELDPVIHQATRLRVVALLHRNRVASFVDVQAALGLTSGNLDSHVAKLEEAGYVERWSELTAGGFQVHLRITERGAAAFQSYLAALRQLLGEG